MNKCRLVAGLFLWTVLSGTGEGQTLVDLRTQSKSVDFSGGGIHEADANGKQPTLYLCGRAVLLLDDGAGGKQCIWLQSGKHVDCGRQQLSVTAGTANEVLSSNGSASNGWRWVGTYPALRPD